MSFLMAFLQCVTPFTCNAQDRSLAYAGLGATASTASIFYWRYQSKQIRNLEKQISILEKKLKDKKVTNEKEEKQTKNLLKEYKVKLKSLKRKKRVAQASTLVSGALALFFVGKRLFADDSEDSEDDSEASQPRGSDKPYTVVFPPQTMRSIVEEFHSQNYYKRFTDSYYISSDNKYPRKWLKESESWRDPREGDESRIRLGVNTIILAQKSLRQMQASSALLQDHARFIQEVQTRLENAYEEIIIIFSKLDGRKITVENFSDFARNLVQLQAAIDKYKGYWDEQERARFPLALNNYEQCMRMDLFAQLVGYLIQLKAAQQQRLVDQDLINETARTMREFDRTVINRKLRYIARTNNYLEYVKTVHIQVPKEILRILTACGLTKKRVFGYYFVDYKLSEQKVKRIEYLIAALLRENLPTLAQKSFLSFVQNKTAKQVFEAIKALPIPGNHKIIDLVKILQISPNSSFGAVKIAELIGMIREDWVSKESATEEELARLSYWMPGNDHLLKSIPVLKVTPEARKKLEEQREKLEEWSEGLQEPQEEPYVNVSMSQNEMIEHYLKKGVDWYMYN